MRLWQLEAEFLAITSTRPDSAHEGEQLASSQVVSWIDDADGVWFLCPKCFATNGGAIGTHRVICWRPKVPQSINPKPGRWEFKGTSIEDLELVAGSSSVQVIGGCEAHFYVRDGAIVDC